MRLHDQLTEQKYLLKYPKRLAAVSKVLDSLEDAEINQKRYFDMVAAPNSKAAAIKAFCCMCMGFVSAEKEVKDCRAYDCPLWTVRPFKPAQEKKDFSRA